MSYAQTDWRALCEGLISLVERCPVTSDADWIAERNELIVQVHGARRAALAQPEPEVGPTDEELLSLDQLREAWNAQADAANSWDELGIDEIIWWTQRQALARWGRPAPAPAGEVAELVGPSDEELWEMYQGAGTFSPIEFARAAIAADRARYGRPAAAPAGEVGELVA